MKTTLLLGSVVFMAELGCLLRSACLVSQYGKTTVFLGTVLGTCAAATVGIFLGGFMGKILPHEIMHWVSGFILIIVGTLMMFNNHVCGSH